MKKLFEGAGVIVRLPGENRTKDERDILVETKYAYTFSQILFKLSKYYDEEIDNFDKYIFYREIAKNYNLLLQKNGDVEKNLRLVLLTLNGYIYFTYGSNMDMKQMGERCKESIYVGNGILKDYKFVLDSCGYASVIPQKGSCVEGTVWILSKRDEFSLDTYEGVNHNPQCYSKEYLNVEYEGENIKMLVYISKRKLNNEPIKQKYISKIVNAAYDAQLSKEYIEEELEIFLSKN